MGAREDAEEAVVRDIGERFGYGRIMQLCERLWSRKLAVAGMSGGEHSVGPCVALLVPCPHLERDENDHCNWCCGSGRVTQRVLKAQIETPRAIEALRRLAIIPTMANGHQNEVVHDGYRCRVCRSTFKIGDQEIHSTDCPLKGTTTP